MPAYVSEAAVRDGMAAISEALGPQNPIGREARRFSLDSSREVLNALPGWNAAIG